MQSKDLNWELLLPWRQSDLKDSLRIVTKEERQWETLKAQSKTWRLGWR